MREFDEQFPKAEFRATNVLDQEMADKLTEFRQTNYHNFLSSALDRYAKAVVEAIVPERYVAEPHGREDAFYEGGWNACIDEMNERKEKL